MKQAFTVGASGIIRDEQKRILLCLRNDYDLWNLPGGGLEKGETPWQGVIREVKEETGFDVEVIKLIGIYSKTEKNEIIFSFECKIISGEMTLNEEAQDIRYFSFHEIQKNISKKHIERIEDALKDSNEIFMRIQNGKSSIDLIKEGKL